MKIEFSKKCVCEYCHTNYDNEQDASNCEISGKILKEWKENDYLKPFMWYKFIHNNIESFVFAYRIQYDYTNASSWSCLKRNVSIFSTNYNNYFNITPSNLLDTFSIEEGYKRYRLIPVFRNQSIESERYESNRFRVETIYGKRNKDLCDKISEMTDFEVRNRLYEIYKYVPGEQTICDLFSSPYNIL